MQTLGGTISCRTFSESLGRYMCSHLLDERVLAIAFVYAAAHKASLLRERFWHDAMAYIPGTGSLYDHLMPQPVPKCLQNSIAVATDFQSQMRAVVSFGQGLLRTQPAATSINVLQQCPNTLPTVEDFSVNQ